MTVAYTSYLKIKNDRRSHFVVNLKNFDTARNKLINGGIKDFYQEKYGRRLEGPEYPATLDYVVAGVAG